MRLGSLCSGYGGLELGVQAAIGGTTAWVSDVDKGACKILAHRFPGVPNIGDMTTVDWTQVQPVDVLTGGTPCQDLSHAGKRAGMTEGTRSNLWVAMREAIATLRPSLVVWENVSGAFSAEADSDLESRPRLLAGTRRRHGEPVLRALGRVLGDLASLGYVGGWHGLRAADVGAPHGRLRVFVVAYPDSEGRSSLGRLEPVRRDLDGRDRAHRPGAQAEPSALLGTPTARDHKGTGPIGSNSYEWLLDHGNVEAQVLSLLPSPRTSGTNGAGQHGDGGLDLRTAVTLLPPPAVTDMGAAYTPDEWDAWTARMKAAHGNGNGHGASLSIEAQRLLPTPSADFRDRSEATGRNKLDETHDFMDLGSVAATDRWGQYAAAIHHWEALTRPAPPPTETDPKGNPRLAAAFSEWMMGLPAGWVTDTPGITRNEALKAIGNGVVPQQAEAAVRFLLGGAVTATTAPAELLPTPSVADGTGGHATRSGARSNELLLPGVARMLGGAR